MWTLQINKGDNTEKADTTKFCNTKMQALQIFVLDKGDTTYKLIVV